MRRTYWLLFFSASSGVTLALGACSSKASGSSSSSGPPDGAYIAEDGAIIGPDGAVIEPDGGNRIEVVVTNETVNVGGTTRDYVLSVPKTYDASRKYPLVIALHGDGQNADGFRTFLGLDDIARSDAISAYPDQALDLYTPYDQNTDQRMIEEVVVALKAKLSIDPAKIWALGYSKGGFIANEIACRKPGLLKAMANHAAGAPEEPRGGDGFPQCPGVVGLPVLASNGDNDTGIGADYAAAYWAKINGCGSGKAPAAPAGCEKYDGCPAKLPVTYCLSAGVSHYPIWPAAARISWDFFGAL